MTEYDEQALAGIDVIVPKMRALPGGTFLLGDENGRSDERPVHEVTIDPFSIAIYPVTNAEFAVFLNQTGHPEPLEWQQPRFDRPEYPVCGVNWDDAVAYGQWLSARTGQCYHLPTEAQREYAARGGRTQQPYPWGDEQLPLEGVYAENLTGPLTGGPISIGSPDAAGPNDYGLYHMADNVHEWCADYYDPNCYQCSPRHNPRGPGPGTGLQTTARRSARGGSWRHHIKYSRCAARSSLSPLKRFADFGFRLVSDSAFEYVY